MEYVFSIITITFNAADVLDITMKSVAEQSFHSFEHIIIDGASTDNTLNIARGSATNNLRIVSEKDKGLYDAMNKGLRMAQGKYVIFLNAGDSFASSETLGLYASAAEKDPDIIYGNTLIVDMERNILGRRHLNAPKLLTFESFSNGMLVCHQAFCVKRIIAPGYDLTYRFSADYDWTIKCIKESIPQKCINLNTVTTLYLDNGLTEKNKIPSLIERYKIMKIHYGVLKAISRHLEFIPRAILRKLGVRQ